MQSASQKYYFRIRDNGASVFKLNEKTRHLRMDIKPIASVNIKNGDIKPHGQTVLDDEDLAEINAWSARRKEILNSRNLSNATMLIEKINHTTNWIQSSATDEEIEEINEELLLAIYDLRTLLTRKNSERLKKENDKLNGQ